MSGGKLPEGWGETEIGDIAGVISGGTPKSGIAENFAPSGEGIAWLTPADLSGYKKKFISHGARDLSTEGYLSCSAKLMPAGAILFSSRAPIGYVAVASNEISTNQGFKSFVFTNDIYPDYAYYYLRNIRHIAEEMGTGTTFKEISGSAAKTLPFVMAPLAEQKIIAEKLDTLLAQVDSTKARLEQIPQILKRFRQAVLAAAISGKLTEKWRDSPNLSGWRQGKLGDFVKKPSYGTSSKSSKEGLVPVLRMGNLQGGKLDWTDLVYTSDTAEIKKYKLENKDVLFNRTNSPELVGKTAIYNSEQPAIYAGYLIRVQCLPTLDPDYLNYHLNSLIAKQYCYSVKSDGVSQSNINAQKLIAYPLHVPPLPEQQEIVRRIEQLFAYADTIEKQVNNALTRVNSLTQSILAKAFRGELTAQWRAENPDLISGENSAAALLEKIKAERAASGGKKTSRKKA
ncbi:TPA: type I restriction-modification system specificity subunit [Raoultella ornithinolytica]